VTDCELLYSLMECFVYTSVRRDASQSNADVNNAFCPQDFVFFEAFTAIDFLKVTCVFVTNVIFESHGYVTSIGTDLVILNLISPYVYALWASPVFWRTVYLSSVPIHT